MSLTSSLANSSSLLNEQLLFITKCDRVVLQSVTALFITKCDKVVLQSATAILLQSATSVITKCDRYYKVRQVLLQSATGITKCDVITKCDGTHGQINHRLITQLCTHAQ